MPTGYDTISMLSAVLSAPTIVCITVAASECIESLFDAFSNALSA